MTLPWDLQVHGGKVLGEAFRDAPVSATQNTPVPHTAFSPPNISPLPS